MRVILKQDIENLGNKGDIVDVAPGFGRNYLIPKRLALEVTSSNMKMIEIERQALKKRVEKERLSFQELIQKLNQVTLSFRKKAGEKDIIFGSVSSSDIKDALHESGFEVDKKKILLEEPIKRLGNYTVPIKIFQEDKAEIKIEVVKEEEEMQEEKKKEEEKVPEEKKEEKMKEADTESKELEREKEEKKEEEIPEEKLEEIEGENARPESEEQEAREIQEEKEVGGEMQEEREKNEAEEERTEKRGEKGKKQEEGEKERFKK